MRICGMCPLGSFVPWLRQIPSHGGRPGTSAAAARQLPFVRFMPRADEDAHEVTTVCGAMGWTDSRRRM
jgi:hypothetical protein